MTILTLQRRLREAGRIRIGAQTKAANGKTRPTKLDAFRLTSSDRNAIEAAAELYGGDPHIWEDAPVGTVYEVFTAADSIPVVIPPAASAFSQYMEAWSGGGCTRRCDGERELLTDSPCMCLTEDEALCKPTTRLSLILRELPGLGVWRLESHGFYAATELAGTVEVCIQAATRGQLLPAVVRLEQRQVKRPGEATKKFAVPVLDIQVTPMELGLVVGSTPVAALPPARDSWQPIEPPAPRELERGTDVGDAIRDAGNTAPAKKRKNSPPELPSTGLNPRGDPPTTSDDTKPSAVQTKKAMALFNEVGITDRDDRLAATAALVGHPCGSWNELTRAEASTAIDGLERLKAGGIEFKISEFGVWTSIATETDTGPDDAA